MRRNLVLALVALFGWAAAAQSAPIDLKEVSADAKWAAHLDMEALMASPIPDKVREKVLEKHPQAEQHFTMICGIWNFDPRTDLHGITVYGSQLKRNTGVALVHAKVDKDRLLALAAQAPDYRKTTYGSHELHSWIHAKGTKHERAMTGTFFKPDVMVFGPTVEEVMAAVDVLDGKKPNFACKESGLSISIPSGAIMMAGLTGIEDVKLPCKSPLCKKINALVMAVGTDQGDMFAVSQLAVKDAEIAKQFKTVMDGALAMGVLTAGDDPDVAKLLGAVKVSQNDKAVNVEWRAPVAEALAGIHEVMEKAKKEHGCWMHH